MAGAQRVFTSVEICAGAGGQAIGLERAGFEHLALVEIDAHACATLRHNRPKWNVLERSVVGFDPAEHLAGTPLDLLAGGVPCPPFSAAGRQLGAEDERDLFPAMLELVAKAEPKAVMIENVRGLLQDKFADYRAQVTDELSRLGYVPIEWGLFEAADYGVPQLRPRSILVALRSEYAPYYSHPKPLTSPRRTVGQALKKSMMQRGLDRKDAAQWAARANRVAPTLVGGSKKHGGADLGPTRAKRQWELLGVDGHCVADDGEPATLSGPKNRGPRLTVAQAALLQGFPPEWEFQGRKTARYRQVGNAFPPPVAEAVAARIRKALEAVEPVGPESAHGEPLPQQRSAERTRRHPRAPRIAGQASLLP